PTPTGTGAGARRPGWRARPSAAGEPPALARHAQGGVRERLEPRFGDGLATLLADAVGAGLDLGQRPVDLLDGGLGLGAEGEVALSLDVHGAALTRLLVELDVAGLHLLGQLVGL